MIYKIALYQKCRYFQVFHRSSKLNRNNIREVHELILHKELFLYYSQQKHKYILLNEMKHISPKIKLKENIKGAI